MVFLTQRLLWPLTRLGETFDLYQRAMASTKRILDLLDTPVGIRDGERAVDAVAGARGSSRFERVGFGYHGDLPVLHGLDLEAAAGETTAIVGPTGSGKSTVVKLLLRFYDVDAGRDPARRRGRARSAPRGPARRQIGVREPGRVPVPRHRAREHRLRPARRRRAPRSRPPRVPPRRTSSSRRLPAGYDTVVGERGQKLSGGQRQRLSIARAVLKDPPILMLDEATSSVDNETEAAIQRSLERIAHRRTSIVIAHRLSTVRNADRIYVLEDGRLAEQGRHEDLIEADGLYAALWRVQTGAGVPA